MIRLIAIAWCCQIFGCNGTFESQVYAYTLENPHQFFFAAQIGAFRKRMCCGTSFLDPTSTDVGNEQFSNSMGACYYC